MDLLILPPPPGNCGRWGMAFGVIRLDQAVIKNGKGEVQKNYA